MRSIFIYIAVSLFILSGIVGCGGAGESQLDSPAPSTKKAPAKTTDPKKEVQSKEVSERVSIKNITLTPENPTVDLTLSVEAETTPGNKEVELKYIFWVDSEIVKEGSDNRLILDDYKKGGFVFVDVVVMREGNELIRKRSEMIRIMNSSPKIINIDFPEFFEKGEHQIKVNAEDADGDTMIFSIEGKNLSPDLSINPETGVIKYQLKDNPPEKIEFVVVVKDDDDGETKQEVSLKLKPK